MHKFLLVGAGETHIYVLKQLQKSGLADVEITLLTPSRYQYNFNMITGYVEGFYSEDAIRMDVQKLTKSTSVEWIKGAAMSIDPLQKVILTDEGALLTYDVVSFDIGTLTAEMDIPGVMEHALVAKPNYRLPDLVGHALKANRLEVVGGNVASVEMTLSLHAQITKQDPNASTIIISKHHAVEEKDKKATRKIEKILEERKIDILPNTSVKKVMKDRLITESNQIIGLDALVWLPGSKSQHLFTNGNLPVNGEGYLMVENTFQVKAYPSIFATGDCMSLSSHLDVDISHLKMDKQAPVLWENIKGFLRNGEGETYHPSILKGSIISTGYKKALCIYKGQSWHGKWAWKIKDYLDRRFMRRYQ